MATHVIIDSANFTQAQTYYLGSRTERTKTGTLSLTAGNVYPVAPFNLVSVLDKMNASTVNSGDNVVIVCHGKQEGMAFPLASNSGDLKASLDRLNQLSSGRTAADLARLPDWTLLAPDIQALIGKMRRVRRLNLSRIEIRGCMIGQWEPTMRAIREFFGARSIGAPTVRNAYAQLGFAVGATPEDFARIQRSRGQIHDVARGRVGFVVNPGAHSFELQQVRATSDNAVRDWRTQMFDFRSHQSGPFAIHCQFIDRDSRLVLPKQDAYVDNLAENTGADDFRAPGLDLSIVAR